MPELLPPDATTQSFIDGAFSPALVVWGDPQLDVQVWCNPAARECEHWWAHRLTISGNETARDRWLAVGRVIRAKWRSGLRQGEITVLGVNLGFRAQSGLSSRGDVIVAWLRRHTSAGEPVAGLPAAVAHHLLDHTTDLLAVTNARREVIWVNQRFEQFTGHALADVRGRSPGDVLRGAQTSEEALRWCRERLSSGQGVQDVDLVFYTRAGQPYWARLTVDPILDAKGEVAGFIDFQTDVTWEHELRAAAQRSSDLDTLGQGFGRIGSWECDLATGEARWDPQVFALFGLHGDAARVGFEQLLQGLAPEEAQRAREVWRRSIGQVGRADLRFRVPAAGSGERLVHAMWQVFAGADGQPRHVRGLMVDDSPGPARAATVPTLAAQFELAVDLAHILIWRHDLETDTFRFNDAAFRLLGLPAPPDLTLTHGQVLDLLHPDDVQEVAVGARRALHGAGPVTLETRYRHADGSYRTMLTRRVAQRDEHGRPVAVLGVAMDLTERVSERQHTRVLSDRLEMIAQAAGVGVWSLDVASGAMEWNAEMFHLYGLPAPEAGEASMGGGPSLQDWLRRHVHPQDVARLMQEGRRAWEQQAAVFDTEFRILRPDGQVRWVVCRSRRDASGTRTFGIHLDVTEHRSTEEALRVARERTVRATELAGVGTWERDLVSGKTHWDAQMYRLRGLPPADEPPSEDQLDEQVHPDDVAALQARDQLAMAEGGTHENEFRVRWPDGTVRWLASRFTVLSDAQGRPVRMLGVNWDVTEHREAARAHQARLSAEQANRAKSDFLARMSHELRTPLNAVLGFTQLLQADGAETLSLRQRSKLAHVHGAAEHLLALINDILDLVHIEAGASRVDHRPVSLQELVLEGLHLIEPLAQQHKVALLTGDLEGWAVGDHTRLRQVLINLLSNAVKYNRPGGTIWVSVRSSEGSPSPLRQGAGHVAAASRSEWPASAHGWVVLQVRDTGRGMNAEQIDRLFDPFDRLGAERDGIEGTGIGMSIVQHLVERMGGVVRVTSQAGKGTEFEVWLQRAEPRIVAEPAATPPAPIAREATDPGSSRGAMRIVYIEDNPVNALLIEELVALRTGVTLSVAVDGLSGVARVREMQPDLVLVDMQLPDIDGFEVLRRLKADPRTARPRYIALSANALPADIARAREAGFDDYWTKPIEFAAFMAHLDEMLREHQKRVPAGAEVT